MTTSELLAQHIKGDLGMLKWHLSDFSDADLFVRPCAGGKHAMWQAGHVIASTGRLIASIKPSFTTPVPASVTDRFDKDSHLHDDPAKFPKAGEIRDAIDALAAAAEGTVKKLPAALLDAPSPEWARGWAATNGLLLAGIASHVQMHIGQIQVIRRCLGKPHLF